VLPSGFIKGGQHRAWWARRVAGSSALGSAHVQLHFPADGGPPLRSIRAKLATAHHTDRRAHGLHPAQGSNIGVLGNQAAVASAPFPAARAQLHGEAPITSCQEAHRLNTIHDQEQRQTNGQA